MENTDSHSQSHKTVHQEEPAPVADLPRKPRRQAAEVCKTNGFSPYDEMS